MSERILVVDDRPEIAHLLGAILAGYDVTSETDGRRALALLEGDLFDVVLADVRMPGVDGFDLLRAARRAPRAPEVIFVTAYGSVAEAVQAVKEGAFDYLEKPLPAADIRGAVRRALEARREGAPAPAAPRVSLPFREAIEAARDDASCEYLMALMREHAGCVTRAAERAGLERESLHRLLRRYGIRSEAFRR